MIIGKEILREYNRQRTSGNNRIVCHAPFQSINFNQDGNATVCCYNKKHVLGSYPADRLRDIWFGQKAQEIREKIRNNDLGSGCEVCARQLTSKSFSSVHAGIFDPHSDRPARRLIKKMLNLAATGRYEAYPRVIEFELSNTCNLECVMCTGYFSSSIRKNREKLPPVKQPYDDAFVDELAEFLPHLTDARFLGGEPFLIPFYYRIWEKIIEVNPSCRVYITTNATILNEKAWAILNRLKAYIIVSIDSLEQENYLRIRQGADWDTVLSNIGKLRKYAEKNQRNLTFSICPMTINWKDIPGIVQYATDHGIKVFFNTVFYPQHLSLASISLSVAEEIVGFYQEYVFSGAGAFYDYNLRQIKGLVQFVKGIHAIA